MTEHLIESFTYGGIVVALLAGGLGLPLPEEAVIIASGVLAHTGLLRWWIALPVCLATVLVADVVLYGAGHRWGRRILGWRPIQRILTPGRLAALERGYRRHGVKIVVAARHVAGVRAPAFVTAGMLRVGFWRFVVADAASALVSVPLGFGAAYLFADQVAAMAAGVHRIERWLFLAGLVGVGVWLVIGARHRLFPPGSPGR